MFDYVSMVRPVSNKFGGCLRVGDKQLVDCRSFQMYTKDIYITEVIYNNPATIVFWSDGTKTVCKCAEGDVYNAEMGLTACVLKKAIGGSELIKLYKDWLPDTKHAHRITVKDVREKHK